MLALIAVLLINVVFAGCGETEDPMSPADIGKTAEDRTGISLAMLKTPDHAPGAPQAPSVGVPLVKAVNFYHNWKLTKEVKGSVSVGDTVFVKMVFSEPMKHVVADDASARPILYYRRVEEGEKLVRFRMVAHGAGGEDFVSGDAKPLQGGTDDYICKYTVVPEDKGKQISFMIGRFSVDLEGVPLPEFYRHKVKLRVDSAAPVKVENPEPLPLEPLTIVSITHYRDDNDELIPEGASVDAGTTIITEIVFAEPVRANSVVISYPVSSGTKRLYQSTGVHWRKTYQISRDGTTVRSKLVASEEVFSLTVERAASLDGSVLKQAVTAPEIPVVPRVGPVVPVSPWEPAVSEPQEPTASEEREVKVVEQAVLEPQKPTTQVSVAPDAVEKRAMTIAKKVSSARVTVAVKGSRERYMNFSEDWSAAMDVIAAEEGVPELSRDLILDLYYIYLDNSPHPMTDYVKSNARSDPSLVLAYFRLRFLNPRSTQEAILEMFKTDVRNGTIKVFLM